MPEWRAVLASSAGHAGARFASVATPSTLFCHVTAVQADVKGFIKLSAAVVGAERQRHAAEPPRPADYGVVHGDRRAGTESRSPPRRVDGGHGADRAGDDDGESRDAGRARIGKSFRFQRYRLQTSVDIFNLLNSSAILSQNNTYGTSWLSPTQILQVGWSSSGCSWSSDEAREPA